MGVRIKAPFIGAKAFSRDLRPGFNGKAIASILLVVLSGCLWLLLATPDERLVVLPIVMIVGIVATSWILLWGRDGALPLLDIGSYYMIAVSAYFLVPLLGYLLSGMTYTVLSHERLYLLNPTPEEIGGIAWRMVVYTFCFAVTYLTIRGDSAPHNVPVASPTRATVRAFVILAVIFFGIFELLRIYYGLVPRPAYDSSLYDAYEAYLSVPLFGRQIVNTIDGIWFVIKLGLVAILVVHWKDWRCRLVLFAWLLFLILMAILQMGGRTELLLLTLGAALLYHRQVKPLRAALVLPTGILIAGVFFAYGIMRGGLDLTSNWQNLQDFLAADESGFSITNEFQIAFGSMLELKEMKEIGALGRIPWQVYLSDLLLLLPQQLLPFEKIDPVLWYTSVTQNTGFFVYGVVAQSILGFDWVELIIRGIVLGGIMASLHRWYGRRASSFWATLFYCWLMLWSYNAVRNTTFYIVVWIVYRFVPAVLLVGCFCYIQRLLTRQRREGTV